MNNVIIWGIITYALLFLWCMFKIVGSLIDIVIRLNKIEKRMK